MTQGTIPARCAEHDATDPPRLAVHTLTLREYFLREFAPVFLADAAPRTLEAYDGTLRAWERYTGDPDIRHIDVRQLAAFRDRRRAHAAASTVNKDLRHLGHMLAKAGPVGHRNRDALGLLDAAPWAKPLRLTHDLPREITLDAIARVYRACDAAVAPLVPGVEPADWHRGLIVYLYNLGARMGHALAQRWADVDFAAGVVFLRFDGDKRGRTRRKPLNATLARHLERIKTPAALVFPLPITRSWFYAQWRKINEAAGLTGSARVFPHDLKRAALTQATGIEGVDPFTVQLFGDHASLSTTTRHYVNTSSRLDRVAERLPQPDAFQDHDNPQRSLF